MICTTSWDDGYIQDLRLVDLLDQYGIKGTFYVCPHAQHNQKLLSKNNIHTISQHHEIGAHTLRHPHLTTIGDSEAKKEIEESKLWIEKIADKECSMFCYPYGDWNHEIALLVEQAGFRGARTTEVLQFNIKAPFSIPTTLQVSPFPKRKIYSRWWHPLDPYGPLRVQFRRLHAMKIPVSAMTSWSNLAIATFNYGLQTNKPIFHLWGHSYEIEKYDMWEELEIFLKHIQQSNVKCVVNNSLLD